MTSGGSFPSFSNNLDSEMLSAAAIRSTLSIAVLLLIVTLLAVGYLSFTGSRLQEMREAAAEETVYEETNLSWPDGGH